MMQKDAGDESCHHVIIYNFFSIDVFSLNICTYIPLVLGNTADSTKKIEDIETTTSLRSGEGF